MRRALVAAALVGLLLEADCREGSIAPARGDVSVRLTTPGAACKAIQFLVVGRQAAVSPSAGSAYRVFSVVAGDTVRIAVFAAPGSLIRAGALVNLSVPDTLRARTYSATVVEVADFSYSIVDASPYVLAIESP